MYKMKSPDIFASEIAGFLGSELIGRDFTVQNPSSLDKFEDKAFLYIDDSDIVPEERLNEHRDVLVLTSEKMDIESDDISFIVVDEPRVKFIDVINEFFIEYDAVKIAETARVDENASIGNGVSIGENVIIGPKVIIGDNTRILNNVVITGRVEIGEKCFIKHNSTIGSTGYDFETDKKGRLVHFPHVGKIMIANNVWIGANSCIESPAIDKTVIKDNVKIDDLVQIGANSIIAEGTMITAGVIISRAAEIGKNCLIAPNASVRDSVKIGDNVTLGIGAVAVKDLENSCTYVGNPAGLLKQKEN